MDKPLVGGFGDEFEYAEGVFSGVERECGASTFAAGFPLGLIGGEGLAEDGIGAVVSSGHGA